MRFAPLSTSGWIPYYADASETLLGATCARSRARKRTRRCSRRIVTARRSVTSRARPTRSNAHHRFEEAARLTRPLGEPLEARARFRNQIVLKRADRLERAIEATIDGETHVPPVRKRREHSAKHRREHALEMTLEDIVAPFLRVEVHAEGEARRGVDREAHERLLDVNRFGARHRALPTPPQALRGPQ
jgi:hypothetical protein